jgi:Phosphopantetheine attachment site.
MPIKLTIVEQMEQIAREHGKILAPLKEDLVLADCGLDSLGFAVLVARLEDRLGIDPFSAAEEAVFPVTLGDFVKVYEHGGR